MYGYRVINAEEYSAWAKEYDALKFDMQMSQEHKDILQETLVEKIESNLVILGATALED